MAMRIGRVPLLLLALATCSLCNLAHDSDPASNPDLIRRHRSSRGGPAISDYEKIMAAGDWEPTPSYVVNLTQPQIDGQWLQGHFVTLKNPKQTISVYENELGCGVGLELTSVTGRARDCQITVNGGFFGSDGTCIGNVISNNVLVQIDDSATRAHFGVTRDGYIVTGYLTTDDVIAQNFSNLIGGLGWIVRNGVENVDEGMGVEPYDPSFADLLSARLATGHNAAGEVLIVHFDGRSNYRGISLYDFADILIQLGCVNCVNLDGGGSTVFVNEGVVASYPTDPCFASSTCERRVSTVVCVGPRPAHSE